MKKIFFVLFLSLLMGNFISSAQAQERVALVNLQRALNEVEEGKRAKTAIQTDMDAKKRQLDVMKEDLKKMRDELEKQKTILSKEAMETKANALQTKFLDLQQKAVQFDQELKQKEGDSVQRILVTLKGLVIEVAKQKGFDIVYENSAETVLYSAKGVDITSDVIAAYNSRKK